MSIELLPKVFDGKGEVFGVKFTQVFSNDKYYIYERSDGNFEVFERKKVPVCIDFTNRVYSETEFKETYPKSTLFGVCAWSFPTLRQCLNKIANEN